MSEFKREVRYVVLKLKDIDAYLTDEEQNILADLQVKVLKGRLQDERGVLDCVVVERDWPEYGPTWKAIERRATRTRVNNEQQLRATPNKAEIALLRKLHKELF